MSQSTNLRLPYLAANQAQKHVTVNEAFRFLDALVQLSIKSAALSAPPGSPADGNRYIVAAAPTGAWAGHATHVAAWQDGAWAFYAPGEGWVAWNEATSAPLVYKAGAWVSLFGGTFAGGSITELGINAATDATNKFVFFGTNMLFNTGGSIDATFNKAAAGNDASFSFKTGFSARALLGPARQRRFHHQGQRQRQHVLHRPRRRSEQRPGEPAAGHGAGRAGRRSRLAAERLALAQLHDRPAEGPARRHHPHPRARRNPVRGAWRRRLRAHDDRRGRRDRHARRRRRSGGPLSLRAARRPLDRSALSVNVTTAVASALGKVVLYASNASGQPAGLLTETGTLDFSTTGVKEATVALTFRKGVTYWLGIRHSSTATLSAWVANATPDLTVTAPTTQQRKVLRRTVTFATAAPNPWTYVSSETANAVATAIWLRSA